MIQIGICDDNAEQGRLIKDTLDRYMESVSVEYQCMLFRDNKAFLYEIESKTNFDLLFLEIDMPEMNGIELTRKVRRWLPKVLIIFVSSYEKYVYDSFQVQPYRFIPKSQIEQRLVLALKDAIKDISLLENQFFVATNQQGVEKILLKSIVYIWHHEKYAYIQKSDGEYTKVRKTMKQIYEELPHTDFVWADRSYICNLFHVIRVKGDSVSFSTGEQLQISRERIVTLRNQVRKYWLRKKEV